MRINPNPQLPQDDDQRRLKTALIDLFRSIARQVNGISEGTIAARHNAATAAPATGTHAQGDFVPNSMPAELGTAGSKYVVTGFLCVAGGTPGTWVQTRSLTGN